MAGIRVNILSRLMTLTGSSDSNDSSPTKEPRSSSANVAKTIESIRRSSVFLLDEPAQVTGHFYRDEIKLGALLRRGEFCHVYEISHLPSYEPVRTKTVKKRKQAATSSVVSSVSNTDATQFSHSPEEEERRRVCTSSRNDSRYSIKHMNPKRIKSNPLNDLAVANLVIEAQFLARFNHPNLIKLRGIPLGEEAVLVDGKHDGFFLMTDMIVETLEGCIGRWKVLEAEEGRISFKHDTSTVEFQKKMKYAQDIASALNYLQDHRLVVLNLTPRNIGFLQSKTLQLFDLGHCKEVPEVSNTREDGLSDDELSQDELSVMLGVSPVVQAKSTDSKSGSTLGSLRKIIPTAGMGVVPRYMAPEIAVHAQYSLKSDSYSFAMILYEMLTLSKPFASYQPGQHLVKVCMEGKRPNLTLYHFPMALETLLRRGWKHNLNKRLSIPTILQVLRSASLGVPSSPKETKGRSSTALRSSRKQRHARPLRTLSRSLSPKGRSANRDSDRSSMMRSKSDRHVMTMMSPRARKSQTVQLSRRQVVDKENLEESSRRHLRQNGRRHSLSSSSQANIRLGMFKSKSDRHLFAMVSPNARKKQTVQLRRPHDWKDLNLL